MKRIAELQEERARIVAQGRELVERADKEKRSLSADEQTQFDRHMTAAEEKRGEIERLTLLAEAERSLAVTTEARNEQSHGSGEPDAKEARMAAFRNYLVSGAAGLSAQELRGLQAGTDVQGGFITAPEQFVSTLIKAVDDETHIRSMATVIPVPNATSLGAASLDTDLDDGAWTSEIGTVAEDTALRFGRRKLEPTYIAKLVKISNELIRVATLNPDSLVINRMAYKFGITHEKAFLTGHGAQQPLGLFTASNDGITTARDVSTGNTATALTFDGLIAAKYSLKSQYQAKATWLFHRDAVAMIAKLKDGENRYLWMPSVIVGQPDTILGRPIRMSEYVPNTFTASQYVGMYADFSFYWIADAIGSMQIQRLNELYSLTNQIGIIGRMATDGMPVLAEAFARVKLAAS